MKVHLTCPQCGCNFTEEVESRKEAIPCRICKILIPVREEGTPIQMPSGMRTRNADSLSASAQTQHSPVNQTLAAPVYNTPVGTPGVNPQQLTDFYNNPQLYLLPKQAPDELGRIANYRVLRISNQGGMGLVMIGEDPELKRSVAIKALRPDMIGSEVAKARFTREGQAVAGLDHENIIAVYMIGVQNELPYLVMPLLKGESLEERLLRERKVPVDVALRIVRETACGLSAAHAVNLIHRDIKPANIFLEEPRGRVKILDFGLAISPGTDASLTLNGTVVGTPAYMAPEQAAGETVDGRADLFALGCILYECLAGHNPFNSKDVFSILTRLATHNPEPLHRLDPSVPRPVSELTTRLLEKDPKYRIRSAEELIEQIDLITPYHGSPPTGRIAPMPHPVNAPTTYYTRMVVVMTLLILITFLMLAFWLEIRNYFDF